MKKRIRIDWHNIWEEVDPCRMFSEDYKAYFEKELERQLREQTKKERRT